MLARKALAGTAAAPKVYVEDVFSTYLYTGNGSTQTITNNIDLSGEGGLVWAKERSATGTWHNLRDTTRGGNKELYSNDTSGQGTSSGAYTFLSSGYSIGGNDDININTKTYASWTFRKAEKFFDVVTYTGNGSNRTISHNLGSTPGCIVVKRTDTTGDWYVYHRSNTANPETDYLLLNSTAATADLDTVWNDTAPTSTVFSVGTNSGVNANSGTYVAYLFAHDAGGFGDAGSDSIIKCGSYSGTGTTNFISLGWEPQWVLVKRSDSTGDWYLLDNMRGWFTNSNVNAVLYANTSGDEGQSASGGWPAATGFYAGSGAYTSSTNLNGGTYIYIAIRRGPMKTPETGTSVFSPVAWTGTGTNSRKITGAGFAPDMFWENTRTNTNNYWNNYDKLRGAGVALRSYATNAETSATDYGMTTFDMDGHTLGTSDGGTGGYNENTKTAFVHYFKRAPGFFDVVCYTGTGSARTISHNLGVVPELMIVKRRDASASWAVYTSTLGNTGILFLDSTGTNSGPDTQWNSTTPTSSVFSLGSNTEVNANGGTFVAYLFASLSGISKIGSYSGNGSNQTINCGFTNGVRFVLIKSQSGATGDWVVFDSTRGIVSGDDPYLRLNSTAAEVTNKDAVDTDNTGFVVNETTGPNVNTSGVTYLYLAIA